MRRTPGHRPQTPAARTSFPLGRGLLLGILGLGLVALPGRSGTLDPARIKETDFRNGLRLIVKEAHATPLVSIHVWVRAGGFQEDEKTSGTAHVIEHLVFKGDDIGGPGSIDGEIENLGGLLEASTEKDWTHFNCTLSGRYTGKAISVIADALRKPAFRQADLDAEKPVIEDEINRMYANPEVVVTSALYEGAFKKHPYRFDVRGGVQFLKRIDLPAIRAYYQKYYVPSNMVVVVVGDVDPAGVERAVRTAFQADEASAKPAPQPLPADEKACETPMRRVLETRFSNGYVGLAYPAPAVKDEPDVYAMDLLLTMLENGGTGRLPNAVRGVAEVHGSFETRRQPGLFTITATTAANGAEQVERLLRREVEFMRTHPVSEAELLTAKRALRGNYALDNEPYTGQAATMGYYAIIDRWQFAAEYLQHVEAITPEQVQSVARKYLDDDHCVSLILKPRPGPGANPGPPKSGT